MTEIEEVKAQIKVLEKKLSFLEELSQTKSPVEIAFQDNYGVYPDELKSNDDFNCWVSFKRGYIAAKKEKVNEYQPSMTNCILEGNPPDVYVTWNEWYNEQGSKGILHNLRISSTEHKKVEEVKKLQEKEWTYKITDEKGETNPYKQYLNSVSVKTNCKPHWEPKPQTEKQVEEGLKEAFREAVKQGVVSSNTTPNSLYDVIADWWDEIFTNGNPSGQNIESLVDSIKEWLPDAVDDAQDDWDDGYNAYYDTVMENLK